ncbi:hypothetical protein EDEG_02370 [Edhazardia aedis USNM 41457]|uniref:Uncharacterized protein n=1 Tax=Edhazardia aedis (strain USNM 41457) TaxID=1003232 RepID=J8ZUC7_EDHAE|nr:hypothetical protein EDEG_02370 [Edhazardia aedis USNM 41457]|eukprot:EJW03278.1 hypothetical protein EDEG_02370 [Edhazardia aedis USNM 41457]
MKLKIFFYVVLNLTRKITKLVETKNEDLDEFIEAIPSSSTLDHFERFLFIICQFVDVSDNDLNLILFCFVQNTRSRPNNVFNIDCALCSCQLSYEDYSRYYKFFLSF